jgi:hypothetical protein
VGKGLASYDRYVYVFWYTKLLGSAMASVQLDAVKAVLAWHHNGTPRCLAEPDPKSSSIRFTLHLNTTSALFEIQIPISYKQHTKTSAIYIHINPQSVTSFTHSVEETLPDAVKPVLGSAICLNFDLNDALSQDQLESLSSVAVQQLDPFSGPDYDISRWFSGRGAKVTTLAKPPPPSYNKATVGQTDAPLYNESSTFDPPPTSHKRKRSHDSTGKQGREVVPNNATIWDKLLELESVVHNRTRPNTPEDQSRHVHDLQAQVAKLQTQLVLCEKKALDRETEIANLQAQLTQCEKKVVDLDTEIAGLRYTQDNADNEASVIISEIEDTLREHEEKIDFVTRGKDDDEFVDILKEEILSELITRISRG